MALIFLAHNKLLLAKFVVGYIHFKERGGRSDQSLVKEVVVEILCACINEELITCRHKLH